MILRSLAKRGHGSSNDQLRLVLIVSIVAGATVILSAALAALCVFHRRRSIARRFQQACSRDPHLTWDEYERRVRLTRSRRLFEEELQRSNIIRKSQQSRASDCKDAPTPTPTAEAVPLRPRTRTWHGRSGSGAGALLGAEDGAGGSWRDAPREEAAADWGSAEASVERTWRLLHGKKSPPPGRRGLLWSEDDEDAPRRPPTVRLKTPPLLSHPLFKDGHARRHGRPRHMSLPTELTRVKTEPAPASEKLM